MGKVIKRAKDEAFFGRGGNEKMFSKGTAHSASAGVSGKEDNGGTAGSVTATRIGPEKNAYTENVRYSEGGSSGRMFSKGHAGKKVPGISGKATQEG